jgi:hypothetical protein
VALESAVAAGEVRSDVDADDILGAVASLCMSGHNDGPRAERMVALFVDGLRYGIKPSRAAEHKVRANPTAVRTKP